jgi:nitrite reductase/ring-hydroxylating ferredoxin subunit
MSSDEIDLERVLCRVADLEATGCREFRLGGGDWPLKGFVVAVAGGTRAYLNRCPHRALSLNLLPDRFLSADGSVIVCCMHGAIFEKSSGLCVAGPCIGRTLAPLPVEVVAGWVMLGRDVDRAALMVRYAASQANL